MKFRKGQFLIYFIGTILLFSCQSENNTPSNFTIDGNVADKESGKLYFMYQSTDGNPIVDTVDIKDHGFTYKGYIEEPTPYYISSSLLKNYDKPPVLVFIEPGDMKMKLSIDNMESIQLDNSKTNADYLSYKKADKVYKQKADSIYAVAMQYKDDVDMQKKLEREMFVVDSLESNLISSFVDGHKNSVVSAYLISGKFVSRGEVGKARELFGKLDKEIKSSNIGRQINEVLAKAALTELGSEAPDFIQKDVNGKEVSLKEYRGKYVLVDFWASWCSPCRQENPMVRQVYQKYSKDNFEIIGISLDKDKKHWINAIKEDNLQWPQLSDLNGWNNEVSKTYGVQSIPENFLIDPDGKIIAKSLRGQNLEKELSKIFKH